MNHEAAKNQPEFEDVRAAHHRIQSLVRKTPVVSDPKLDAVLGCRLFCKCENLQEIGAFKIRGAMNAVLSLREQRVDSDLATHSSGNHGAAVAAAARQDGRKAIVVMPENSVEAKVANVRRFGGEVVFCAPNQKSREQGLQQLVDRGLVAVHPYDQREIICGQGTAALELLEQRPELDILMTPVGGGGLIAGSAIAARHLQPGIRILAAEPEGAADTAESLRRGERVTDWQPDTVADGLRATVGELPFLMIQQNVEDVLTVSENAILVGMELIWRHLGMLIEPSSATVIAAILQYPEHFSGQIVGVILTGGNVDPLDFPELKLREADRH